MRKVHILMTVTMGGHDGELDRGYYADNELSDVIEGWATGAIEDRDDSPQVTHYDATVINTSDGNAQKLAALEAAGVGNWEGYGNAMAVLRGEAEEDY